MDQSASFHFPSRSCRRILQHDALGQQLLPDFVRLGKVFGKFGLVALGYQQIDAVLRGLICLSSTAVRPLLQEGSGILLQQAQAAA